MTLIIEFIKGVLLFVGTYALYAFVAFGIFGRGGHGYLIIPTWLVLTAIIWIFLWRKQIIAWTTLLFFILVILALAIFYFIPITEDIPPSAHIFNNEISEQYENRYDYAEELFFSLAQRWTTPTRQYLLEPHKAILIKNFTYFWSREGEYADSNIQAQIYRLLLIASERFNEEEVWLERHGCITSPHTVVAIQKDDRVVRADLWAADHFDEYEFGMYSTVPCKRLHGEPMRQE